MVINGHYTLREGITQFATHYWGHTPQCNMEQTVVRYLIVSSDPIFERLLSYSYYNLINSTTKN